MGHCVSWPVLTFRCGGGGDGRGNSRQTRTVHTQIAVRPRGGEGDKAGLVSGDFAVDPALILRHSSVDSWKIWQGTLVSKTHDSRLHPDTVLFAHHRTSRVPLNKKTRDMFNNVHTEGNQNETVDQKCLLVFKYNTMRW